MTNSGGWRFNHDLLVNEGDVALARQQFPEVADLLDWPELRLAFLPHDEIASRLKAASRRRGLWGLAAGLAALWLAVIEQRLHEDLPSWVAWAVAALVLGLGICGVLLGSQVLRGRSKSEWLHHRAATERLRQLHFQFLVRRVARVAATDAAAHAALKAERDTLLAALRHELDPGVRSPAETIIMDMASVQCWLVREDDHARRPPPVASRTLSGLLAAYAKLRFEHQADHATKQLDQGHGLWPREPAGRARRIHDWANALTLIVIVAHLLALVFVVQGTAAAESFAPWLQTAGIMATFGFLALRVLDDGLQPRADVARSRQYRAEVTELRRRFEAATDLPARVAFMERMEELSYRELRDFLTQHNEASFVF